MFLSRLAIWPKNKKDSVGVPQRLLRDYGRQALSSYVMAFGLCLVVAACPAATAYLFGTVVNKAYVNRYFCGEGSVVILVGQHSRSGEQPHGRRAAAACIR
jgi:hypothetical protein